MHSSLIAIFSNAERRTATVMYQLVERHPGLAFPLVPSPRGISPARRRRQHVPLRTATYKHPGSTPHTHTQRFRCLDALPFRLSAWSPRTWTTRRCIAAEPRIAGRPSRAIQSRQLKQASQPERKRRGSGSPTRPWRSPAQIQLGDDSILACVSDCWPCPHCKPQTSYDDAVIDCICRRRATLGATLRALLDIRGVCGLMLEPAVDVFLGLVDGVERTAECHAGRQCEPDGAPFLNQLPRRLPNQVCANRQIRRDALCRTRCLTCLRVLGHRRRCWRGRRRRPATPAHGMRRPGRHTGPRRHRPLAPCDRKPGPARRRRRRHRIRRRARRRHADAARRDRLALAAMPGGGALLLVADRANEPPGHGPRV